MSALERQALIFGFVGLVGLCFSLRDSEVIGRMRLAVVGIGFFSVPMVVVEVARGGVGEISRSALFAVVPVVVLLVIAAGDSIVDARGLLLPALAALGGLLLLLPLDLPASGRGRLLLGLVGAAVVVVGVSSVVLYRSLSGVRLASALTVVCLANAIFLLVSAAVRGELQWSGLAATASLESVVDVAEMVAIVWLLREMPPERFAARFLLIPLVTILESYALARPDWTARIGFGTVLLVGGAAVLLVKDVDPVEAGPSLR